LQLKKAYNTKAERDKEKLKLFSFLSTAVEAWVEVTFH
jgi:hypothetical protein